MKKIVFVFMFVFALLLVFNDLKAQHGSFGAIDAKSNGMGACANASAFALSAIGKNPALLNSKSDSVENLMLKLPDFSFQLLNNSLSMKEFTHFFGNENAKYLSEKERNDLLGFFQENGKFYFSISAIPLAISYTPSKELGTFAFSVSDIAAANIIIAKDLIDLSLIGNDSGRVYSFNDSGFKGWWLRSFNISYARQIYEKESGLLKSLSAGITLKFITGYEYSELEKLESRFHTGENSAITGNLVANTVSSFSPDFGVEYDFDKKTKPSNFNLLYMEPAGIGYGIDLGFYSELENGLNLGLAITDIGAINWSKETVRYDLNSNFFVDDILDRKKRDSLINSTNAKGDYISDFSKPLPSALRFGASYELSQRIEEIPGVLLLALDYNQGFNDLPGNSRIPRIGFGAFWHPDFDYPYILTGVSNAQTGRINFSLGAGYQYDFFQVNISTYDLISLISKEYSSPNYSLGINLIWKIL
ncbi:MAG: hypothetical protein GX121_05590 [Ignavibacteria bacterium]|nr:hypothetical protein [Ignavibacteria bacterium]